MSDPVQVLFGKGFVMAAVEEAKRLARVFFRDHYFLFCLTLTTMLFSRSPASGFIFDEQEAILGNPYVQGQLPWTGLWSVDFWGRASAETIGSYRPLPVLIWRILSLEGRAAPFVLVLPHLVLHAKSAWLLEAWARSRGCSFGVARSASLGFLVGGVHAEVVTGIVGLSDLLFGVTTLLYLRALEGEGFRAKALAFFWLFLAHCSKETAIVLGPLAFLHLLFLRRDGKTIALHLGIAGLCVFLSTWLRLRYFLAEAPFDEARGPLLTLLGRLGMPAPPTEWVNNPLAFVSDPVRWISAWVIVGKNLLNLLLPLGTAPDYSAPAELPLNLSEGVSPEALVQGLVPTVLLLCWAGWGAKTLLKRAKARPWIFGLLLFFGTLLPVANLIVTLPTVRADRLLYVPSMGFFLALAEWIGAGPWLRLPRARRILQVLGVSSLVVHAAVARLGALGFSSDLSFWSLASQRAPKSAKAQLNLGVMYGVRGDEPRRLQQMERAAQMAPAWPLAQVYWGDSLCRLGRVEEAFPHYRRGLALGPNQKNLVALALTCTYEKKAWPLLRPEWQRFAAEHPGTWIEYLVDQLDVHGDEHQGLPPEYRARGYNQKVRASK